MAWKYINPGDYRLLDNPGTGSYSARNILNNYVYAPRTGMSFHNNTLNYPVNIPVGTKEIWLKANIFCNNIGSQFTLAFGSSSSSNKWYGFSLYDLNWGIYNGNTSSSVFINSFYSADQHLKVYLHIRSDATNGIMDISINDGNYSYSGNIANGGDLNLNRMGVSNNNSSYYISDLIISDEEIDPKEHVAVLPIKTTEAVGWTSNDGTFTTDSADKEIVQSIDVDVLKNNVGLENFAIKGLSMQMLDVGSNDLTVVDTVKKQLRLNENTSDLDSLTLSANSLSQFLSPTALKNPFTNEDWTLNDLNNIKLVAKTAKV